MTWRVPFVDFPLQWRQQEPHVLPIIQDTLAAGDLMMRHQLHEFEEQLAAFVGTRFAVGVSNCTDAIRLFAHAMGIGTGDEIVSVAHTFVATISPFALAGAEPVLVDIGSDHNLDTSLLRAATSDRTRVIIPVHLNGRTCRMDEVIKVADEVGAVVLEDAAQALGAKYRGQNAGTFGVASVYSFYPAKLLGALGDAGALLTDDPGLADEVRLLRDHYRVGKNELGGWGYNCRLDNVHAAVLSWRLKQLPGWIERRRALAQRYDEALRSVEEVSTLPGPSEDPNFHDVFQNYPVLAQRRDDLVRQMTSAGIETLVSWPVALHQQGMLGLRSDALPVTEHLVGHVVSLPLFPELRDDQVDYVAQKVSEFYAD